jgi:TPP-dependent pyruvate/acetoin dehydrogenase alpha subunit
LQASIYPVRGLEGVCAAIGASLRRSDYLVSTYRNLGDAVAKGVPLGPIVAEAKGKVGGTSKGKGGPMHLSDPDVGFMVTTGVVGSGIPIANGLALAAKLKGEDRVTLTTFGDGATSIGASHEAFNLAALWRLPLVFVCQNNGWGEHTPLRAYAANPDLAARTSAYGMPAVKIDGFDPVAAYDAISSAVERARLGEGPTFVEAVTYRLGPHSGASDYGYMPKDELNAHLERDPTPAFRASLLDDEWLTEEELGEIDRDAEQRVTEAFAFAEESPVPASGDELDDVFADRSLLPRSTAR